MRRSRAGSRRAPAGCLLGCVGPRSGPDHFCVVRLAAAPLPERAPSGQRLRRVVELDRERAGDEFLVLALVDRASAAVLRPAVA